MGFWIRLADEDRAQYDGCPEMLTWEPRRLSIDEAIEIQERSGLGPAEWRAAIGTGSPSAVVWKLVVWLCLNRAGLQIGYSDVRFDWVALEAGRDADDPGKESSSTPPPPSEAESGA